MEQAELDVHPHVLAYRKRESYKNLIDGEMRAIAAARGAAHTDSAAYMAARTEAEKIHADKKPTAAERDAAISGELMLKDFSRYGGQTPRNPLDRMNRKED